MDTASKHTQTRRNADGLDDPSRSLSKRLLPRSLLGRSLLIIVVPLIVLQVVSTFIFYETHWDKVSRRMASALAGDIATVIDLLHRDPSRGNFTWVATQAHRRMELAISVLPNEILPNRPVRTDTILGTHRLITALERQTDLPFFIDTESQPRDIIVLIQMSDAVLRLVTTRKRLSSTTTHVFVLWMVGTSAILFAVATMFMRNQVRPIRRLAQAAESFGKGADSPRFKPEGAREVRQAAAAFLVMRERITRHIGERTQMLAGVSHDLRTPLTRMKLQLAMLPDNDDTADLQIDVDDMERMLGGYLAFARGEGDEKSEQTNLRGLLQDVVARCQRDDAEIDLHCEGEITIPLKPNAMTRCITNLVENALRFAEHVSVRAGVRDELLEITIDDDGPGIPPEERDNVFRPFYRIETSRNPATGGVGLGMAIARDVARGHGGAIVLNDSPNGGLRAQIRIPL